MFFKDFKKDIEDYYKSVDTAELLQYLMNHYEHSRPKGHCDEFDEVVTPWPTGFVFDETTDPAWVELLQNMIASKKFVVFGRTSDVNGDFCDTYKGWQEQLSVIWKVDTDGYQESMYCTKKGLEKTFCYGFYPNYATLMGPLPRCIIWKCFKLR